MTNQEIFSIIRNEFTEETAVNATILISINKSMTPTNEEMLENHLYIKRLNELFNNVLWQLPENKKSLCLKVWEAWYNYEIGVSFNGMGGCVFKTLKELIGIEKVVNPLTVDNILDNMDR